MQTAYAIMNVAFAPALREGPIYVVMLAALFVSVIFALIYRIFVDRRRFEYLKTELKSTRERMKTARAKHNEGELRALMQKMLHLQNQQMLLSVKPMFVSLLLVAVVFSWLSYMYGDITVPLNGEEGVFEYRGFTDNFTLSKSQNGTMELSFSGSQAPIPVGTTAVLAGKEWKVVYKDDVRRRFQKLFGSKKLDGIVFKNSDAIFHMPYTDRTVSWVWVYIIASFPATFVSRKLLGVD